MSVQSNLEFIRKSIPSNVKLVAVSKTMPVENIQEAYEAGQRLFGENKAQELAKKHPLMPSDVKWHFIGHLQTNKVKYFAHFVDTIESVDSLRLLQEINKQATKSNRVINCLLQFYIAEEESKFGLDFDEASALLDAYFKLSLSNVKICGVMGMATFTDDKLQLRKEFKKLQALFVQLKNIYFADKEYFKEISMGMSSDYQIAIEEGATSVRVGSSIFGERNYL